MIMGKRGFLVQTPEERAIRRREIAKASYNRDPQKVLDRARLWEKSHPEETRRMKREWAYKKRHKDKTCQMAACSEPIGYDRRKFCTWHSIQNELDHQSIRTKRGFDKWMREHNITGFEWAPLHAGHSPASQRYKKSVA